MQQLIIYNENIYIYRYKYYIYVAKFSSWKELSAHDEKRLDLYFKNSEII